MFVSASFTFRPLERDDLPLLMTWLSREHVARWWEKPDNPEEKYFESTRPVRRFIASLNDTPVGMAQCYRWADLPSEAEVVGAASGDIGIDYLIGEEALIGRGVGVAMLQAFIDRVVKKTNDAQGIRVDVSTANERSWRCLEKLGFIRERAGVKIDGQPEHHFIYARPL